MMPHSPSADRELLSALQAGVDDAADLLDKLWPMLSDGGRRAVTAWFDEYISLASARSRLSNGN